MIRVVLDTNVVVSAMLNSLGTAADVLRLALNEHVQLCVSEAILEEYEGVLRRPKFRRPARVVSALMKAIRARADKVEPTQTLAVSADDADNRFLECAQAAGADYIVTGNQQHFRETLGRTRIISPRQLVGLVTPKPCLRPTAGSSSGLSNAVGDARTIAAEKAQRRRNVFDRDRSGGNSGRRR